MKRIADIWYVSMEDLVNQCSIGYRTVEKGYTVGSSIWQSIKDPEDRRRRLIRYDTMGDKYQKLVQKLLCEGLDPDTFFSRKKSVVLSERSLVERVEQMLTESYKRYEGLYCSNETSYSKGRKTTTCLARAAGVIELVGGYIQERRIDLRSYAPYKEVVGWLETDDNYDYYFPQGCQYLPLNPIRFKEKVMARFGLNGGDPQPITEVIKLPRKGNTARVEFKEDAELLAWVAMARMHGRNDTNAYVIRKIQEVCRVVGREVPSASWFSQILASNKMKQITAPTRFGGDSAHAGRYTHSITMARAMYAGDCWMIDATRVNMVEHQDATGKKAFLVVIAVRDAYSGDIVGVHFDTKEDRWGYTNALKMAVKVTGYLPHTLVHDRFPGHLTDEMTQLLGNMERKGVTLVCTHKATGKALLERWFDTMQTVFLAKSRYYYGQGIRSTREYAHRSNEYLLQLRKEANREGFSFDQAWQEAWQRIEEYRQTPISHYSRAHKGLDLTPAQLHGQSEKPNVIPVALWDQSELFWLTKVLDIRRNAISHEVHGKRYEYPIYDTELLYRYSRVAIRYEESDPATIMLFAVGADDKVSSFFIGELKVATPVTMYGPDADPAQLAKRMAMGKRVADQRKADLETIVQGTDQDPEYLLAMGRHLSKEEFERVESQVLYEHMGAARGGERPAVQTRTVVALPTEPATSEINIDNFLNY